MLGGLMERQPDWLYFNDRSRSSWLLQRNSAYVLKFNGKGGGRQSQLIIK